MDAQHMAQMARAQPGTQAQAAPAEHAQHGQPQAMTTAPAAAGAHGGHDMSPVDISRAPVAPPAMRGNLPLESTIVGGVREFALTAGIVQWHILPELKVGAYAYNGQVPGPLIRLRPGERVRVRVKNELPEPTTVHWHGLIIDNAMDGASHVTQPPIEPGREFAYEFTVPNQPGTHFYHTHHAADRQQPLGLYGALIIEETKPSVRAHARHVIQLGEWRVADGQSFPAMDMDGMRPNYFTINGKSYPATETVKARVGDRLLFRFIGSGQFIHPMHIHGGPFEIVATDGNPVPPGARLKKDTVLVGPGERYDVLWTARKPGKWLLHCHINHHTTNDGAEVDGGGGLVMVIDVRA
jgi:FtsP/CotA-like multicopper oxidase with cupredoxin domain